MKYNKIDARELTQSTFPLIVDFDLKNMKPRGGSTKIDFFENGRLCDYVCDFGGSQVIYLQKDNLLNGIALFLVDFDKCLKEPEYLGKIVKGMKIDQAYVEDSRRFNINHLLIEDTDIDVTLVNFL